MKKIAMNEGKFSLHDARISRIKLRDDLIKVKFKYIFDYSDAQERTIKANVCFEGAQIEECEAYVMKMKRKGDKFKGKRLSLSKFVTKYGNDDIEVITESYRGYISVWDGYLYRKNGTYFFIIKFINEGERFYEIR